MTAPQSAASHLAIIVPSTVMARPFSVIVNFIVPLKVVEDGASIWTCPVLGRSPVHVTAASSEVGVFVDTVCLQVSERC